MIDFERIPKVTYLELVELIGEEEAEKKIKELGYQYKLISSFILITKAKYSFRNFKRTILSTSVTGITIKLLVVCGLAYLAYYVLKDTGYF